MKAEFGYSFDAMNAPMPELDPLERALNELREGKVHVATWEKALSYSSGDKRQAKEEYLRLRSSEIQRSTTSALVKHIKQALAADHKKMR